MRKLREDEIHNDTKFGLKVFYSSQHMTKDRAEQKAMFSPLHNPKVSIPDQQ